MTDQHGDGSADATTARIPATPATPPPGGPADPVDRTVTPVAHPTVVLEPNPAGGPPEPPYRRAGVREIVIGVAGIVAFVATFLTWQTPDFGDAPNAWTAGSWPAGVLALGAAAFHLVRMLPPADKAFGALLPLLLCTAAVWIPIAAVPGNGGAWGIWVCLIAGIVLTGGLLAAAMTDPALRSEDDPDDLFD